jgi:GT2 family glycosyltransferase
LLLGVSIIIPTRDRKDLLEPNITSLIRTLSDPFEIIIVDNGSKDIALLNYFDELRQDNRIRIMRLDVEFNFSKLCNYGASFAHFPFILLLNDDVEAISKGWLEAMITHFSKSTTAIVGARLIFPSGALQHCGIAANLIPGPGHPWLGVEPQYWHKNNAINIHGRVDAVTAACLLIKAELYKDIGGLDETDFAITLNDVDLCLKARKRGLDIIYEPLATLVHKEGQSRQSDNHNDQSLRLKTERKAFYQKYSKFTEQSCFYPLDLRRDTTKGLRWYS